MKFFYIGKLSATAVDAGKQDLLRGNYYQVEITCYDENNSPITLAGKDVAFIIRRQRQSSTITYVIREDDMTISGNTATITLNSGITISLVRSYYWEFGINFADNQVNTLAYGAFNFKPSELATAIADEFDPPTLIDPTPWLETMETNLASSESAKTGALASEVKAGKWAEEDEDVEVETGKYSAKHHAAKAQGAVDTHEAKTTNVHGITSPAEVESTTGAQAKVDTHENKEAPHSGHETPAGAQAKVDAILSTTKGSVVHGDNADADRPDGYVSVEWIGSVEPLNAANNDTWVNLS